MTEEIKDAIVEETQEKNDFQERSQAFITEYTELCKKYRIGVMANLVTADITKELEK